MTTPISPSPVGAFRHPDSCILPSSAPQLGLCIMYPSPGTVERIGPDWDWIWLDGQHGQMAGYREMLDLVRACESAQRPAFIRVPAIGGGWIGLALDTGASAVIVPQIEDAGMAREAVRAAKFPPLGERSYGGRRPIDKGGRLYSDQANAATKLVCQIESPMALRNAEEIAAVPGVDALFLGPDDLLLREGVGMNAPRTQELLGDTMKIVAGACRKHGKTAFTVAVAPEMITFAASCGFQYIVAGGDVPFLANGSQAAAGAARKAIGAATQVPRIAAPAGPQPIY